MNRNYASVGLYQILLGFLKANTAPVLVCTTHARLDYFPLPQIVQAPRPGSQSMYIKLSTVMSFLPSVVCIAARSHCVPGSVMEMAASVFRAGVIELLVLSKSRDYRCTIM